MNRAVFGVNIDGLSHKMVVEQTKNALLKNGQFLLFTPNPELLVKAYRESYFRDVLNKGSLRTCDGFGLWLGLRLRGIKAERFTGVDCLEALAALAANRGKTLFLLGSGDTKVLENAQKNLEEKYKGLRVVGYDPGPKILQNLDGKLLYDANVNNHLLEKINAANPDILAVAFNDGKQEKWILENNMFLPGIRVFVGVGGALDFLGGKIKRAPRLMRIFGLEWLYRMIRQPRRVRRIWNAVVVFSYLFVKETWKQFWGRTP